MKGRLVLASASPRRIELLQLIGLNVLVIPSGVTESPLDGEGPRKPMLSVFPVKKPRVCLVNIQMIGYSAQIRSS